MTTVLIYDIASDRIRLKVADACLDYGLERIQYSAFMGEISTHHLDELLLRIRKLIGRSEARVEIFPICEKDLRLRRSLIRRRPLGTRPSRASDRPGGER